MTRRVVVHMRVYEGPADWFQPDLPWKVVAPNEVGAVVGSSERGRWWDGVGKVKRRFVTLRWDPARPDEVQLVQGDRLRSECMPLVFPWRFLARGGEDQDVRVTRTSWVEVRLLRRLTAERVELLREFVEWFVACTEQARKRLEELPAATEPRQG